MATIHIQLFTIVTRFTEIIIPSILHINMCGVYIWANYNDSLTWIKVIWGWFPLLTMIPVRSQWGRYNLPRYMHIYIYIHTYIYACVCVCAYVSIKDDIYIYIYDIWYMTTFDNIMSTAGWSLLDSKVDARKKGKSFGLIRGCNKHNWGPSPGIIIHHIIYANRSWNQTCVTTDNFKLYCDLQSY